MPTFSDYAANALMGHVHGSPYTPASGVYLALSAAVSVVNASYQWTASGSGINEFYLEAAGGGDPGFPDPEIMIENGSEMAAGSVGSLAAGEFDFGDNDTLGFNSIYVRLSDGADPDTKSDGFVLAGSNPGADGSGLNEPAGADGYSRKPITFNAAAARRVTQGAAVVFAPAAAAWGWITHWAVMDSETGGHVLAMGPFSSSQYIPAGLRPKINAAAAWVQIGSASAGGLSDYAANGLLDLMFRNQAFSISGLSLALMSADVGQSDEDISTDCTELTGTDYARVTVNSPGGAAPAFAAAASREVLNADDISWGVPGADDWTVYTGLSLITTAGKILVYENNVTDFTPGTSDDISIPAGDYSVKMGA